MPGPIYHEVYRSHAFVGQNQFEGTGVWVNGEPPYEGFKSLPDFFFAGRLGLLFRALLVYGIVHDLLLFLCWLRGNDHPQKKIEEHATLARMRSIKLFVASVGSSLSAGEKA